MVMAVENALEVEMVNPENDSTHNMITSSGQICSTQLLDASIEDVRNGKNTMVSKIDSVIKLMNKVEHEEKAAAQAKKDAAQSCPDAMLKVYQLIDRHQCVKKKNDMLAREAYAQKKLLSTKMESLQLHVTSLLDKGDRSLEVLDDMSRSLEVRLTSAIVEKKSALKNEAFARAALAYAEIRMAKVEEESNRMKQETVELTKLQEFITDRGHLVTMLHGEISDKCQEVKRLKEELDQVIPPGGKISSGRKWSISASSSSSLVSLKKDHVQPANYKQIKGVVRFSEADIKSQHIKKVKIKRKLHGYRLKIKRNLCTNQMFAKCIKKVKLKGKLHGNEMFVNIKKMKLKSKLHGNHVCVKNIKKLKNLKIQGKQYRSQICAKSVKKVKINNKLNGNQLCPKSIKIIKIRGKQQRCQVFAKSVKKVRINGKQQGCQKCVNRVKKVKIKGLQVV